MYDAQSIRIGGMGVEPKEAIRYHRQQENDADYHQREPKLHGAEGAPHDAVADRGGVEPT